MDPVGIIKQETATEEPLTVNAAAGCVMITGVLVVHPFASVVVTV